MALTIQLTQVSPIAVADQPLTFLAAVTNTGASSVTLSSLQVSESTESDAQISQPNILTTNVPVGLGNPTIIAGGTFNVTFGVIFPGPAGPGPSPNQPAGTGFGPSGMMPGQPPDNFYTLLAQAQSSDNSISSQSLVVTVLSATAPFPVPQGGAAQFAQGANSNLIAAIA